MITNVTRERHTGESGPVSRISSPSPSNLTDAWWEKGITLTRISTFAQVGCLEHSSGKKRAAPLSVLRHRPLACGWLLRNSLN